MKLIPKYIVIFRISTVYNDYNELPSIRIRIGLNKII